MQKLTIVTSCIAMVLLPPAVNSAVFVEVASASYCPDCPPASELLFKIYSSREYPFYYVTMVGDKNERAYERIKDDYNFYWYPTAFFDGGYKIVLGADEEEYRSAIEDCMKRDVPSIRLNLNTSWNQCPCWQGIEIEIEMENNGDTNYGGNLKVYIAEINSRWEDNAGRPYNFAFLDFAYDENITLTAGEEIYLTIAWIPEQEGYPDIDQYDMNNIMVYAVLFNKTAHLEYANPPDKNPFNAYYVDAVSADAPGGNISPFISIISPKQNYLYILDREIIPLSKTVIIGKKTVEISAFDEDGIDKIEIYVDDILQAEIMEGEKWVWKNTIGQHTLKAVAYDIYNLQSSDSIEAFIFSP